LVCPIGHYNFNNDPADGCEVTCDATHCVDASGTTLQLNVLPPYALGTSHANMGSFASGAALSSPMTGTNFTNSSSLASPGASPLMVGNQFQSQGGFLH
jgi:hypothetical protein